MVRGRIAFLYGPKDLRIEEVNVSDPRPNEVLIQVKAAGICGSDVECYEGKSGEGRYDIAPYTPGHEWAGQVVALGSQVTGFRAGDMVTGDCVLSCFRCENCKRGLMPAACLNMREVGFRPDSPGGWGEYLLLEENYVHRLPADWSYAEGALVEPFSVGYYGVWGPGGWVDASDDVVILGSGTIGLSALIVCKTAGARVVVIEPLAIRREYAKRFGADVILNPYETSDLAAELATHMSTARGPSVLIEASGNDSAIASLFDLAGLQPRVRLIGHSIGHKVPVEIGKVIWRGMSLYGEGGTTNFLARTISFMSQVRKSEDLSGLISHTIPFEKLDEAMQIAVTRKDEALKVMLTFS
jgi:L-iditol 2-dehydrogenase